MRLFRFKKVEAAQQVKGAVDGRFDRAHGTPRRRCYLCKAHLIGKSHEKNGTVIGPYRVKQAEHTAETIARDGGVFRGCGLQFQAKHLVTEVFVAVHRDLPELSLGRSLVIPDQVQRDGGQPGTNAGAAAELLASEVGLQKAVLNDVACQVWIPNATVYKRDKPVLM